MADKKYNVVLTASDQTKAAFDSVTRNIKDTEAPILSLSTAFNALTTTALPAALISFGRAALLAAEDAAIAQRKLQAIYKATGGAVGFTTNELNRMADAMAASTHFDDEAIRNGMSEIIKFGNVTGAVLKDSLQTIADYAAFSGRAFPEAASSVAKALADPETAAKLLKEAGVVLTTSQKSLIKSFRDVGDEAGAQSVVLDRLQSTYGGMEAALNSGLTGATKALSNEWSELLETFGKSSGSSAVAEKALGGISFAIHSMRDAIDEASQHHQNSLLFFNGKGAPLQLSPPRADTGPLAGKTISDVQAVNSKIAAMQAVADDAAAVKFAESMKKLAEKAAAASAQLMEKAKRSDLEMTEAHKDSFTKTIDKWVEIENQLVALGASGTKARQAHEAAYTGFVNDENTKRLLDAENFQNKQSEALSSKQQERFQALSQMAFDADASDLERAMQKQSAQLADLDLQRMIMATDHELTLAELAEFEQAKADIIKSHGPPIRAAQSDLSNFSDALRKGEYKSAMDYGAKMTAGLAMHSRAAFNANKIFSLSMAGIKGVEAVQSAYAHGNIWGGPVGGAIEAGAALLFTGAQIDAINSASFGGGASASPASGGTAGMSASSILTPSYPSAPPPAQVIAAPAVQQYNFTVIGAKENPDRAIMSYNSVLELMDKINHAGENGHRFNANLIAA